MDQLVLHIEYSLHHHNCVIVPGLGGFVVNTKPSQKEDLSIFHSPECEIVFNRSLTYNDGLLVESYMRVEGIPFELASQKIERAVKEIHNKLKVDKIAELGDLGSFEMNDEYGFIYNSKSFVRPEYYGMSTAALKPIIQLKPKISINSALPSEEKRIKPILPKIGIGVAVAAVILLFMFVLPVQDTVLRHQTAQMLTESNIFAKTEKQKTNKQDIYNSSIANTPSINDVEYASTLNNLDEDLDNATLITANKPNSDSKLFYIIVGVYEVRSVADKMIENLKSDGYTNCNTIDRPTRIDVYAESFSTRENAYKVLNELRQNPKYKDAWVLER